MHVTIQYLYDKSIYWYHNLIQVNNRSSDELRCLLIGYRVSEFVRSQSWKEWYMGCITWFKFTKGKFLRIKLWRFCLIRTWGVDSRVTSQTPNTLCLGVQQEDGYPPMSCCDSALCVIWSVTYSGTAHIIYTLLGPHVSLWSIWYGESHTSHECITPCYWLQYLV